MKKSKQKRVNIIRVNKDRVNIEKRMRKVFPYTVFTVYGSGYNRLYHGKGEDVEFGFKVGRWKCCGCEVATGIDYNSRKSEEKICAYKKERNNTSV